MNKPKAVIFDYDDVLVNYCKGIVDYALDHYGLTAKSEPNSYNLEKTFDVNTALVNNILLNFNNNSFEFGLIDVIDDYVKGALFMLKQNHPEVDIFVVTKCGNSSKTVALRKVNAANHFGKDTFEDILFLNPNETKAAAFKKIKRTHDVLCVVDDHIDNINTAHNCGIKTFVYERTHNVQYKDDARYDFVQSWAELYHKIENLIKN